MPVWRWPVRPVILAPAPVHGARGLSPRKMQRAARADNRPRAFAAAATDPDVNGRGPTMALSRSSSWKEHRLATRLEIDGAEYTVDLVARKATGVEGWKVTVVYLAREGGGEVKAELPNAASTAEVRRLVTELEGADDRLRDTFRRATQN